MGQLFVRDGFRPLGVRCTHPSDLETRAKRVLPQESGQEFTRGQEPKGYSGKEREGLPLQNRGNVTPLPKQSQGGYTYRRNR